MIRIFVCVFLVGVLGPALAPDRAWGLEYNWYVRHSGGDDDASGTNWNQAWSSLQKAWDEVACVMTGPDAASNAGGAEHMFGIHLQATGPGEVLAGAASDSAWWNTNAVGTILRGTVMLRGGYDAATGSRVGATAITNAPNGREGIYVNLYANREQYLHLVLSDVAIRVPGSAVQVMDARAPRVSASRSRFFSASVSASIAAVDINGGNGNFTYGDFSQCEIRGGGMGLWIRSGNNKHAWLCMTNCAVAGSALAGVRIQNSGNPDAPTRIGQLWNTTLSCIGAGKGVGILVEHSTFDYGCDLQLNLDRVLMDRVGTNVVFSRAHASRLVLAGGYNAFFGHVEWSGLAGVGSGTITNGLLNSLVDAGGSACLKADGYHLQPRSPATNRYPMTPDDPGVDIDGEPRPPPARPGRLGDIGCDEVPPFTGTIVTVQ